MDITLKKSHTHSTSLFLICTLKEAEASDYLNKAEKEHLKEKHKAKESFVLINKLNHVLCIQLTDDWLNENEFQLAENMRMAGSKVCGILNGHKQQTIQIEVVNDDTAIVYDVVEGIALTNYQFNKYKSKKENNSLKQIEIISKKFEKHTLKQLRILVDSVYLARNWVNEPQSYLDAIKFAAEMKNLSKKSGLKVEVFGKKQIESLKMGGLLAVNKGSKTPPTFTILEWKPKKPINKKPIVLVGKGVVYDTGGVSLKPTASMDTMKCDMAGGALVGATLYAVACAELNLHVIGLVPATDNRPGENAYVPGDVITMFDGSTVEMLNADAEGRMILADALAFAKKYKPELVFDFATLTGAAAAAIGQYGIVCMGTADEATKLNLKICGNQVYERLVEFPFWDDYAKLLKSDIADMKNIGGPYAGAITAGKFLEKFTDYPWMHFDIAGPAYYAAHDGYRPKNGTGIGVRLMFNFLKSLQN